MNRQGMIRVEVLVRKEYADWFGGVATALGDPKREVETRQILREQITPSGRGLKELLASAPLMASISIIRATSGVKSRFELPSRHQRNFELRKGDKCHPAVADWWARVSENELYLSTLVIGEIRKGVELARAKDPHKADVLERWLGEIASAFADRILPIGL